MAQDEPPVVGECGVERELAGQDPADQLAAAVPEVERRPDAFGRERQALPGRVPDGEEAPDGGAAEPAREERSVIARGRGPEVGEEQAQRRPEPGRARVAAEPDEAAAAGWAFAPCMRGSRKPRK